MTMKPNTRKLALTAHITLCGGWIGAVLAYLGLVVRAMTSPEEHTLRAVWAALNVIGWYVIVPLALAALGTGLLMAVGTSWGLARHHWVLVSLVLTVIATGVLLIHMPTVGAQASVAAPGGAGDSAGLRGALRGELLHAGLGLVILLAVQTLNVYKPHGVTARGRRGQGASGTAPALGTAAVPGDSREASKTPVWVRAVWIHAAVVVLALVILHVAGGGFPHHR